MTSPLEGLAARVAAIEERLNMESGLRASQDADLASLAVAQRAQTHLIQALALTQTEHTSMLAQVRSTLAEHGALLRGIAAMLQTLIDRGDA